MIRPFGEFPKEVWQTSGVIAIDFDWRFEWDQPDRRRVPQAASASSSRRLVIASYQIRRKANSPTRAPFACDPRVTWPKVAPVRLVLGLP